MCVCDVDNVCVVEQERVEDLVSNTGFEITEGSSSGNACWVMRKTRSEQQGRRVRACVCVCVCVCVLGGLHNYQALNSKL